MREFGSIFVSYARVDSRKVAELIGKLRADGFDLWIDEEGIEGAAFWRKEIVEAIRMCSAVLFFASEASCQSENVSKELAGTPRTIHPHSRTGRRTIASYCKVSLNALLNSADNSGLSVFCP